MIVRTLAASTFTAALGMSLAGCDQGHTDARVSTRPAEPPPQLWRIAAVQESTKSKVIQLCADGRLASGFTAITPEIDSARCLPEGDTQGDPPNQSYKCKINGQEFGVSTNVGGHYPYDFVVFSNVVDIDAQRTVYSRSLHFSHVGACPADWKIGQATDQRGQRVAAAFIAGTNTIYQAQR